MTQIKHPILDKLTAELEDIASQWNGDESDEAEDMAGAANEAIEKVEELKELLAELDITF